MQVRWRADGSKEEVGSKIHDYFLSQLNIIFFPSGVIIDSG